MTDYTIIDARCRMVVETNAAGGMDTKRITVRGENGSVASIPLTTEMMRELGYYSCLWYRQRTGKTTLMPSDFVHPDYDPNWPTHECDPEIVAMVADTPPAPPTPPEPRKRTRWVAPPPPEPAPIPAPTPRVRTRTFST